MTSHTPPTTLAINSLGMEGEGKKGEEGHKKPQNGNSKARRKTPWLHWALHYESIAAFSFIPSTSFVLVPSYHEE